MCSNNDYITLYILVYKKVNDFIVLSVSLPVDSNQRFNDIDNADELSRESTKGIEFSKKENTNG